MVAKSAVPRGCAAAAAASSLTAKRQPTTLPSAGVCIAGPACAYVQLLPERSQ
jgi:hypothetical protein